MLLKIGKGGPKPLEDAASHILDCHQRIRSFTEMAVRLGSATGSPESEVKDAAVRVHRYFTESLPRHAEDEDRSIAPRLVKLDDRALTDALMTVEHEHKQHDAILLELVPMWAEIAKAPERLAAFAADLATRTKALAALIDRHLELEERVVVPAMKRLTSEDDLAIRQEMRARRPL